MDHNGLHAHTQKTSKVNSHLFMGYLKYNRYKILSIGALIITITLLHYLTRRESGFQHVFYRELYYLPIILSGFWFGLRGGLITALSASLLYFPFIVQNPAQFTAHDFGNLMTIILFALVGGLLGWMSDREVSRQRELRKSESLAAMGKAVSFIAHDMKTPLVAIGGLTARILRKIETDNPAYAKLEMVLAQSNRLENMVKDMLAFSRPLELHETEGDLNALMQELAGVISETAANRDVCLTIVPDHQLPRIPFDRNRLQQVLLNLMSNAVEASPAGEEVIVQLTGQEQSVIIDIIDHGEGIPKENHDQIFSPFFSTKKEGTGLGLCIAKKIVEAHGGSLDLLSNQYSGVTFRVEILKK